MSVFLTRRRVGPHSPPSGVPRINYGSSQAQNLEFWVPCTYYHSSDETNKLKHIVQNYGPFGARMAENSSAGSAPSMAMDEHFGPVYQSNSDRTTLQRWGGTTAGGTGHVTDYPLSCSFWVKRLEDTGAVENHYIRIGNIGNTSDEHVRVDVTAADQWRLLIFTSGEGTHVQAGGDAFVGQWYHIGFVLESSTSLTFYTNGIRRGTITNSHTWASTELGQLVIGGAWSGGQRWARWADIRIYNSILGDGDMAALASPGTRWAMWEQPGRVIFPLTSNHRFFRIRRAG